jgi:hypothetical protein
MKAFYISALAATPKLKKVPTVAEFSYFFMTKMHYLVRNTEVDKADIC